MKSVTLEEAQLHLPELISTLQPGQELVITKESTPVARLVGGGSRKLTPRQPGSARGILQIVADDDEHLQVFSEYMP